MDIMELGAIGELVGAVAVIGSLIFVGIEIRSNTKTQRASSGTDIQQSWVDLNLRLAEHPSAVAFARATDPHESLSSFDEKEIVHLSLMARAIVQNFEAEYYQYQAGLLSSDLWHQHRSWCHSFIQLPAMNEWWQSELRQPIYTPAFIEDIGTSTDIVPVGPAAGRSAR